MSDTSDFQPKSRTPHCSRCSNHKIKQEMRNHKGKCPFQDCECQNCEMTKQRQKILNAEIQVYRKRRADLNKKLKSDKKFVNSRKRVNSDEKLPEFLFKQMEDKIKNVIRNFVIKSSGNAGLDVENWISKGIEMSQNSNFFPQNSSFATLQPTMQLNTNNNQSSDESSSGASRSVNSSPDNHQYYNYNLNCSEAQQIPNFQNMDVDSQNSSKNYEFNEEEFQSLMKDLRCQLGSAVKDAEDNRENNSSDFCLMTKGCENVEQTSKQHETQMQNFKTNCDFSSINCEDLVNSPSKCQLLDIQQHKNSNENLFLNTSKKDISRDSATNWTYQVCNQNNVNSIQKVSQSQSSSDSAYRTDYMEFDTQAELQLIDDLLESLSDNDVNLQTDHYIFD